MLRRIVGPQAAAAMVVFGQILDGTEAERVGLAWPGTVLTSSTTVAAGVAGRFSCWRKSPATTSSAQIRVLNRIVRIARPSKPSIGEKTIAATSSIPATAAASPAAEEFHHRARK